MKKITNKTILKQGDKSYSPVEVDGVIYWVHDTTVKKEDGWTWDDRYKKLVSPEQNLKTPTHDADFYWKIVAQSLPIIREVPIIYLGDVIENIFEIKTKDVSFGEKEKRSANYWFKKGFNSNPNQYTQEDIEKAIDLARLQGEQTYLCKHSDNEILEQINSISVVEVDEQFDVISYE
jgi:hypothetical protein